MTDTTMRERFIEWLTETDCNIFGCEAGSYYITVIRIHKNKDFDYLYCQRQYHGTGIERGVKLEYAGIYCKRDGLVYDSQYNIHELRDDGNRSNETLREGLKQRVRQAVDTVIGNDRRNLRITHLSIERDHNDMVYFQRYTAPSKAREAYLSSEHDDGYKFTFGCHYNPANWTEDSLLEYILNPTEYSAAEAAAYIDSHQEDMLTDFIQSDMIASEYTSILENPQYPIHRVKRIMAAVGATSAKMVTVTIRKNDIELTFKTEADQFRRDCVSHYSDWSIVAKDRREFERLFGHYADYTPDEILRITYARSVLYQAEEEKIERELVKGA